MARSLVIAAAAVASALAAGCATPRTFGPTVTYVPTNTPGVMYVVVHPSFPNGKAPALTLTTGARVSGYSDYVLLCDARPAAGMRCEMPGEASTDRVSFTSKTTTAVADVDEMVGALGNTEVTEVRVHEEPATPEMRPTAPSAPAPATAGKKASKEPKEPATPTSLPPPPSPPTAPTPGGAK